MPGKLFLPLQENITTLPHLRRPLGQGIWLSARSSSVAGMPVPICLTRSADVQKNVPEQVTADTTSISEPDGTDRQLFKQGGIPIQRLKGLGSVSHFSFLPLITAGKVLSSSVGEGEDRHSASTIITIKVALVLTGF